MFSDLECRIFFRFWRAFLWEGCQKCNFCLQKIFLKRWQVLRNSFFCFWVWSRKFLTFVTKLLHGFENWSSTDHRIFSRKKFINGNINTWSFPEIERKTAPISVNFFWRSVKRQSMTAEELLEQKVKIEINFDSLGHKFLAWVSFLLSTCPGEPFEEEIVSMN